MFDLLIRISFVYFSIRSKRCFTSVLLLLLAGCGFVKQEDEAEHRMFLDSLKEASELSVQQGEENLSLLSQLHEQQAEISTLVTTLNQNLNSLGSELQQRSKPKHIVDNESSKAQIAHSEGRIGSKSVIGRVEWLWLPDMQRYFAGQLNTALDESLIYADDMMRFEREGDPWLRFSVERQGWPSEVEARITAQKRFSYPGTTQVLKAPVVSLPVELSGFSDAIDFLVIERKKTYPQFVVGRNFLTDIALVDVSQKYIFDRDPERIKLEAERKKAFDQRAKKESDSSARGRKASDISGNDE